MNLQNEQGSKEPKTQVTFALIFPIAIAILLAAVVMCAVPFSQPMSIYYEQAHELLDTGKIQSELVPIGYSGFLAFWIKLGGRDGIFLGQALLYLSSVVLGFIFLTILGSSRISVLLGSCAVAAHPYLLANIKRIVENNLVVPLFLAFCVFTFYMDKNRQRYGLIVLWGCLLGLLAVARANALSLLGVPFILFKVWGLRRDARGLLKILVFLFSVFITIGSVTAMLQGRPLYLPTHGPANFFLGANEKTANYLLGHYSPDYAFTEAIESKNISLIYNTQEGNRQLFRLALRYIIQHPIGYARLCALKFVNLFRPDYRLVAFPSMINSFRIKAFIQTLLAAPFFLWLCLVMLTFTRGIKIKSGLVVPIIFFYGLPYIIAMPDPRYRLPIDIVMILDSIYRFISLRQHAQSRAGNPKRPLR